MPEVSVSIPVFGLALIVAIAAACGCDLRGLARDELFGPKDALAEALDERPDQDGDQTDAGAAPTGNLSGTVSACGSLTNGLDAQIAIAGRRKCSFPGKGSYFFRGLPVGRLRLVAIKDGYERFEADVVVDPAGVVFDVDMVPTAPFTCTNLPSPVACSCTDPTCEP